jgi:COP9 signalosome complex subunit 5
MGMLQGKIMGDTFVVMDSFALPVEGTETRVNAASEANEYMVQFADSQKVVNRKENVCGWCVRAASPSTLQLMHKAWSAAHRALTPSSLLHPNPFSPRYHSHPGYGCWLSGIDVGTQMTNQQWQEPFLAIVIDPHRTMAAGKVEIGAFRTYPEVPPHHSLASWSYLTVATNCLTVASPLQGYKPPDEPQSEYQTIPLNKIEDFGVHAKSYYSLDISYFKSSLDSHMLELLWNKYWVNTLSASPLLGNRDFLVGQIQDLGKWHPLLQRQY